MKTSILIFFIFLKKCIFSEMNYPPVNMREREETRRVQDTNNQLLGAGSLRCTLQLTRKNAQKSVHCSEHSNFLIHIS